MDNAMRQAFKEQLLKKGEKDFRALEAAFQLCRANQDHETNKRVRALAMKLYQNGGERRALELHRNTLLFDAPENFDAFMRYMEFWRPPQQQFWLPRRAKLSRVCQALQDMEDGKLDELFLSMPPRTGKSTLVLMFTLWIMLRNSERSNLYCSYTESVVKTFYKGLTEILNDKITYNWQDVFPEAKVVSTDAKDLMINIDRNKRYPSFTGRSLYGTLNGACDCSGYEIADDLISGIEEALNAERLTAAWLKVENNYLPRAKESAKRLWIGTRWSLLDVQARRMELLQNDNRYSTLRWQAINVPALDENDESNFVYDYGAGFSTKHFHQVRISHRLLLQPARVFADQYKFLV